MAADHTVPALARGLDILLALGNSERDLTAPELIALLGIPRASMYGLLKTLESRGFVQFDDRHQIRLGSRLLELGGRYAARLDLADVGHRAAKGAAERCGETVQVAVLEGTDVVYIAKVDSVHAVKLVSRLGGRLPGHLTGVGKAILAHLPNRTLDERYPAGSSLPGLTENSITSTSQLRTELAKVRDEGVAWDRCESNEDIMCVAAPVRSAEGQVVAGLSISVPVQRWTESRSFELKEIALEAANRFSTELGFAHNNRELGSLTTTE